MATMRRHSKKRDAILACIRDSKAHPSAEWIYTQLKPEHPDLSLGTVYRNLNLLAETGEIRKLTCGDRLDADTDPHAHFICDSCDAVVDVDVPMEDLRAELQRQYGCEVQRSSMIFHGLCSSCKEKILE